MVIDKLTNEGNNIIMTTNTSPRYHLIGQPDGIIIIDTHHDTCVTMKGERSTVDHEVYTRLPNGDEVVDWIHDPDDRYTTVAPLYHFLKTIPTDETVAVDHRIDALLYHDNEYIPPKNPVYTVGEVFDLLEDMCFDFWNEYMNRAVEIAH